MATTQKKTFLVTGGNSGLGFQCCLALAKQPDTHVVLAGRSKERVDAAVAKIKAEAHATSDVEAAIVDIGSLASVRVFAESLKGREFFTIVCNAGVQQQSKVMTVDGFESTFGVNHLGHFLLVTSLHQQTKRVVMLGSETHDPKERTGLPVPNIADLGALSRGLEPFDAMEAYATSKLLNMVFAAEFARRYPDGPEIVSYTPGLTPDTGLFRQVSPILFTLALPIIRLTSWWTGGRVSTSVYSGGVMARVASEEPLPFGAKNDAYIRVDEVWEPSELVHDKELGTRLWEESLEMAKVEQ